MNRLIEYKKEEPRFYAKIKGWELHVDNGKFYWRFNPRTKKLLIGFNDSSNLQDYTPILTKSQWADIGITDENAEFEEVKQ